MPGLYLTSAPALSSIRQERPGPSRKKTPASRNSQETGAFCFYMLSWNVRLMTSSCCSLLRRLKFTA